MIELRRLLNNSWFRVVFAVFLLILITNGFSFFLNATMISPLQKKVNMLKRGASVNANEVRRLEKQVGNLEDDISNKMTNNKLMYQHYYTMGANPVLYINQFVLTQSKPSSLIINSSSVSSNSSVPTRLKKLFTPNVNRTNISSIRNFSKYYSVNTLKLSATGTFFDVGQFLSNIYALPVQFYVSRFSIVNNKNFVRLDLTLIFVAIRTED